MATYLAQIMHGNRNADRDYQFEAGADLMDHTPSVVLRTFIEHLNRTAGLGQIDYELNAAMKSKSGNTVTALGNFIFSQNDEQPFICMISKL